MRTSFTGTLTSMLDGVAAILDIGDTLCAPALPLRPAVHDRLALANDWAVVGADLRSALADVPDAEASRSEPFSPAVKGTSSANGAYRRASAIERS
jgi:hypothetical protein